MVLWWPTRPSRTNTEKWCPFHYRDWNAKLRSQEITWSEVKSLSRVWLFATPWTVAYQASQATVHGVFQARVLEWVAISFSRDTRSNRQVWHWSTKWSRTMANEFCQEKALVIAYTLFQQHKRQLYPWTSPDSQYWNQSDYILCSQRWRSSIQSVKTRLGADCGSDHELLIAKFRLKLKKVGKITRPFSSVQFSHSDHSDMT